ncbi:MAG: PQQ-dependent dehydrogenase, methanol/ethanol family [Pseudomonadota bacterium]|nr:PQQ-dependent dehydrogenase, methanol/ethanol family [Pseudomonadota bacterium]
MWLGILGADGARTEPAGETSSQNWDKHGATDSEQRFSTLQQINKATVGTLGLAWSYELDSNRGQEATPLEVDGVLYTTTAWSKVVALQVASGKLLWKYDPKVAGSFAYKGCCDVVNRGPAIYEGKVYFGALDGRLIALDAKTGRPLWSVLTVDQSKPYTITGAPRIAKGKVIIGNSGADFGVRGYVTAYDANSGKQLWRFYTVPGNPAAGGDGAVSDNVLKLKAAGTWSGRFWESGGGGTVWDSIVFDPELNQIYLGVGNGSPWNPRERSAGIGDNLFLSSIVALDADTGTYKWHYQETPQEAWDFTATQQMILASLTLNNVPRKVLLQAPKNGFFYVIDRTDGKLISAEKYVPANWASGIDLVSGRPIENPAARYPDKPFLMSVGGAGGHNWQPMSFSPKTGLVYIPAQELPMMYQNDKNYRFSSGNPNTGIEQNFAPIPPTAAERAEVAASLKGRLLAWDPVHQHKAWSVEHRGPWNGGTLATAGGLVFEGTSEGEFAAYDDTTGEKLWSFQADDGIMAGPVSFAANGQQYIAVLSGYGGAVGLALPEFGGARVRPPGRVLVFAVGGRATLPHFNGQLAPANPPAQHWDVSTTKRGGNLFAYACARCHGSGTLSAGVVPDLRRSGALTDGAAWNAIVIGGALKDSGMVSFANQLSRADAEAIRAYVASEARLLKSQETQASSR